tara:strand:- start:1901 stop:2296 length:396 start_codon:yes stop_codon:yes gene_type:complete
MTNGDSTIEKQIEKRLGISIATWDKIELGSIGLLVLITLRQTLDVVGTNGILGGRLKSRRLERLSRLGFERNTWKEINVLSTVLGAALLLKNAVDVVESKTNLLNTRIVASNLVTNLNVGNLQGNNRNQII